MLNEIQPLQEYWTLGTICLFSLRDRSYLHMTVSSLFLGTHSLLHFGKVFHWKWQAHLYDVTCLYIPHWGWYTVAGGILDPLFGRFGDADAFILTWCTELSIFFMYSIYIFFSIYHKVYLHSPSWRSGTLAMKRFDSSQIWSIIEYHVLNLFDE